MGPYKPSVISMKHGHLLWSRVTSNNY